MLESSKPALPESTQPKHYLLAFRSCRRSSSVIHREPQEEVQQAHSEFIGLLHDRLDRFQFRAYGIGNRLVSGT